MIKHMTLSTILFSCLTANIASLGMNEAMSYPQIQLKDTTEESVTITLYGMITESFHSGIINHPIKYASKSIHAEHFKTPTTIKDPIVKFTVANELSEVQFYKMIPLKHCFNLNDNSELTIVEKQGSQAYPNNPLLKDKLVRIRILCKKNPKLFGDSFAEQKYIMTNNFFRESFFTAYKNDILWVHEKDNVKEFLDAGIIKQFQSNIIAGAPTGSAVDQQFTLFEHGTNGCLSQQHIRQDLIDEKIPNKQTIFKALITRQINGKF